MKRKTLAAALAALVVATSLLLAPATAGAVDAPTPPTLDTTATAPDGGAATTEAGSEASIAGVVSCEGCSSAPVAADVTMVLAVPKPGQANQWATVDRKHPTADGRYGWPGLTAGTYMVFALYSGTGAYSAQSNSDPIDLATDTARGADVLIARLIPALPGVKPATNSLVSSLYNDYLNRLPSASETTFWANLLQNAGTLSTPRSQITDGFVTSDEYRLIRIDAAYQGILGRAAEPAGRQFWLEQMRAGSITTDDIETSLYASEEYLLSHGGTTLSFAQALYTALLHRDGAATEWAFWADLADRNGRDWVIDQFWDSDETISERVALMYEQYLGRVPEANGLQGWVGMALVIGDSGLRSGLTSSDEYYLRAQHRFQES